jgi:phosphate transport system substrate-binding protein
VKFARHANPLVLVVVGALTLTGCTGDSDSPTMSGTLDGAGATSQAVAQEVWIAAFQTANPDVTINYDPSGSGAGREAFIAGGADFGGSDSPLNNSELAGTFTSCAPNTKAIDLPVYISPIAMVFNIAGVTTLNLDAATLAKIFNGTITNWNDPAITALNKEVALPAAPITAVHRSDDSGTTKNFIDYLHAVAPEIWTQTPTDNFPFSSGEGAQGTSGVVDAVTNGINTIGYVDASRAGALGVAKLKVGNEFVSYSPQAAAIAIDSSPDVAGREANDIAIAIDRNTTAAGAYPLVLVSYIIACQIYANPHKGSLVKAYLNSIATEQGQTAAAAAAGSAPISSTRSEQLLAVIETIR